MSNATLVTDEMWNEVNCASLGETDKVFELWEQTEESPLTSTPLFDELEANNQTLSADLEKERSFVEFDRMFEGQDLTGLSLRTKETLVLVAEVLDGFNAEKQEAFGLLVEQILNKDTLETHKEAAFLDLYDELTDLLDYLADDFIEALNAKERIDVFILRDDVLECEFADIEEMAAFVELGKPAADEFMKLQAGALQLFIDLYEY